MIFPFIGGTYTVLVPDDQAFDYLSIELKDALSTNVSLAESKFDYTYICIYILLLVQPFYVNS